MIAKLLVRQRLKIFVGLVILIVTYHVFSLTKQPASRGNDGSGGLKFLDFAQDNRVQNPVGDIDASTPDGNIGEKIEAALDKLLEAINDGDKNKWSGDNNEQMVPEPEFGDDKVFGDNSEKQDAKVAEENVAGDKVAGDKGAEDKEEDKEAEDKEAENKLDDTKVGGGLLEDGKEETSEEQSQGTPNKEISAETLKTIRDYSIFFNPFSEHVIKAESLKDNYILTKARELFTSVKDFLLSKSYLETVLNLPQDTVDELKESHSRYVKHIDVVSKTLATFGNILPTDPGWNDYKNSKGYVLVGGGRYSWLSYLVIKQIRATGSTLPIELFIPSSLEYEKEFCETLLPKYNAYCNLFDDELSLHLSEKYDIGGYQYKMLALLSSKFENIIYLDSDNFPVRNPEYILESSLFEEKGLILWPDAWARTTNPKFYDIAGVTIKENKLRYSAYDDAKGKKPLEEYTFEDSWYHDFEGTLPDPTSETGMFMINKTKHLRTLLLILYYNVLGPKYYYPLLTQGSAGEGDKETFIAAAHVLDAPWFQTAKQFKWCGYKHQVSGEFTSKALGHYDPIQSQTNPDADIDMVFMHLSYPKFYPNWLADNHDLIYADLGDHIRMYADVYDNAGYDFDLRVLQYFTQGMCSNYYVDGVAIDDATIKEEEQYMGRYLQYVKGDREIEDKRCEEIFIPHLKWLKETTDYPNLVKN